MFLVHCLPRRSDRCRCVRWVSLARTSAKNRNVLVDLLAVGDRAGGKFVLVSQSSVECRKGEGVLRGVPGWNK